MTAAGPRPQSVTCVLGLGYSAPPQRLRTSEGQYWCIQGGPSILVHIGGPGCGYMTVHSILCLALFELHDICLPQVWASGCQQTSLQAPATVVHSGPPSLSYSAPLAARSLLHHTGPSIPRECPWECSPGILYLTCALGRSQCWPKHGSVRKQQ